MIRKHNTKFLIPIFTMFFISASIAQSPKMSSGLKRGSKPTPTAATSKNLTRSGLPKLNMGNYIELDESIKDEPYEGTIDFPDAELTDIMNAISKVANKNFILDASLKGKRITVLSPQKVTKEEAYNVFLTALFMNNLTVVASGKYLRVIPSREAPKSNVRVFYGDFVPASDEIVTLVYPLKNISSEDMPRIFQDLLPRTGNILVYPETNSVIMTDSGLNLRRMISILKAVDVPGSQPKLESIPVNYASAKDVARLIEEILDAQSGGNNRRTTSSRLQKEKKIQGGGVITKIVPDERTNSLVVLANGKGIEQLRSLIAKLDSPNATNSGNIHIYFIKNAVAEELATTMNNLLSASGASSSSVPSRVDPNIPNPNNNNNNNQSNNRGSRGTAAEGVALEGAIKVVADKATNSLVIRATAANYSSLKKILERLDIPRRQVNVEATIMEIRVRDADKMNIASNIAVKGFASAGGFIPTTFSKADFQSAVSSPAALGGLVAGFAAGKMVNIKLPDGSTQSIPSIIALFQAIQDLSLGQIMQQPNILTSDNEPGLVNITEKIKVRGESTQQVSASGSTIATEKPETVDVTLELKVTPQIGEDNNLVKLKVEQTMEDYSPSPVLTAQIDKINRKATTVVVVRDGDTVVIGGFEKNDYKSTKSKVPLLGDLPIIGTLFRGSSSEKVRSNLMLFLTPKIIRENNNLLELTQMKLKKRQRDGKDAYDPKDYHRKDVSAMLKDTDERMKGKKGWGFKNNTSAYLQEQSAPDDIPQEQPKAIKNDEPDADVDSDVNAPTGAKPGAPSGGNNIEALPPPGDLEDSPNPDAGLETLDIR